MKGTSLQEIIPVLQVAIGPVILVSGIGLLLLTMTNRLGRVIDRARLLSRELREPAEGEREPVVAQLRILSRRARIIRLAIALASFSVLLVAILVIMLFLTALVGLESAWPLSGLFIVCMASLIGSLCAFLLDINVSLEALKMELAEWLPGRRV